MDGCERLCSNRLQPFNIHDANQFALSINQPTLPLSTEVDDAAHARLDHRVRIPE